jgi:DmsE family decaheme c-type cytochrome
MRQSVGTVRARLWALGRRYVSGRGHLSNHLRSSHALAVAGAVFFVAVASFAVRANAADIGDDSSLSALRSYVQTAGDANRQAPQAAQRDDGVYDALRAFTRPIGDESPQPVKAATKLADADNLLDWLRGGGKPNSAEMPAAAPARTKGKSHAPAPNASYVGSKVCLGCHTAQAELFGHTLMGRLQKQGKIQCESCHGPGSEHVRLGGGRGVGGILSMEADDPRTSEEKNAVCLGCHERGQRTLWQGSVHQERGLACVNCHTIMKAVSRKFQLKTAFEPDTCFQCHKDRRAQMFRSSHMPMREGKVVCSDCHNPHGSVTESLLKKDSINDVCYTCHAEKRGPFLFEHEPVRENCDNCHDPHGSIQQYSLKIARPRLCNECHNLMDTNHTLISNHGVGQACENCHTAIHGSNAPNGQLLFR